MTFKRASNKRELTFKEISAETRLPLNDIELLVMKGLAQGLVKGAIDQVAGTVHMTWVQPRVLNKQQVHNFGFVVIHIFLYLKLNFNFFFI
jgi:26S proteasome regulatory subunit N9